MYRIRQAMSVVMVAALVGVSFITTSAQTRPYRLTDRQVEQILRRVETSADGFRSSLDAGLDRSRLDGTRREDNINEFVRNFEDATDRLRERFDSRNSAAGDVETVLDSATRIDRFLRRNTLNARVNNDWSALRANLDALANAYNVTWDWNNRGGAGGYQPSGSQRPYPPSGGGNTGYDAQLTGTYRLDPARSDNPRDVADRATRNLPSGERQRIYDVVSARLASPDMIAIERRGSSVTISSSNAQQTNFEADGQERSEQLPNGRVARVRADLNGDQLVVSSTGYRDNDFSVTFDPADNGRRLEVTRTIYSERLTQPVVVRNLYDRTSDVAQWNIYDPSNTRPSAGASGDFGVRNGETLIATLDNNLSTKAAKENDPFTLTVRSPAQFEGAVIEGTITGVSRSGRISGRSGVTFNFDRIRLRNGQTYRFAGFVDSVRTTAGETVRVDNEGGVRDDDTQTERTVQRAAIGTAVGAIIGAIAGGGKGAAIGAAIGAAGGAGSVYVQGRDDLELLSGTEFTVRASAPNR